MLKMNALLVVSILLPFSVSADCVPYYRAAVNEAQYRAVHDGSVTALATPPVAGIGFGFGQLAATSPLATHLGTAVASTLGVGPVLFTTTAAAGITTYLNQKKNDLVFARNLLLSLRIGDGIELRQLHSDLNETGMDLETIKVKLIALNDLNMLCAAGAMGYSEIVKIMKTSALK